MSEEPPLDFKAFMASLSAFKKPGGAAEAAEETPPAPHPGITAPTPRPQGPPPGAPRPAGGTAHPGPPSQSERLPAAPQSPPTTRLPAAPQSPPTTRLPAGPQPAKTERLPAGPQPAKTERLPAAPKEAPEADPFEASESAAPFTAMDGLGVSSAPPRPEAEPEMKPAAAVPASPKSPARPAPRQPPAPSQAPAEEPPLRPSTPTEALTHGVAWKETLPPVSLDELFARMLKESASDLHLSAGLPPNLRVHGDIHATTFPVLTHADIMALMFPTMTDRDRNEFVASGDVDYSIEAPGVARFRVNCSQQNRGMAVVFRVIPKDVPRLEELGLPAVIGEIAKFRKGLVVVTGPTGSGKSTTLAAVLNQINESRQAHIITIEDPLEFVHESKHCLVTHREIGRDANSFADALRAAIREDPDIVLVGEMRDLDTVAQAIKAAEMGLLVLGTLHTNNAAKAVDRVIDIFPANQQDQIRTMLSESLKAVVAQQLLKRADGKGRVAVHEVLVGTSALANMIREGKTHQIASVIQTGKELGMQSMDAGLIDLVQRKLITPEAARERAVDLRSFQRAGIVFEDAPAG